MVSNFSKNKKIMFSLLFSLLFSFKANCGKPNLKLNIDVNAIKRDSFEKREKSLISEEDKKLYPIYARLFVEEAKVLFNKKSNRYSFLGTAISDFKHLKI